MVVNASGCEGYHTRNCRRVVGEESADNGGTQVARAAIMVHRRSPSLSWLAEKAASFLVVSM